MAICLGLYVEENLIKYAKVEKDKDNLKVEAFGVKFYDKLGDAIKQIVSETYSFKVPISINLSNETYNYFYFINLLNKNDLKKAIDIEFESFCYDKNYNKNALESRYALVPDVNDKEKIKAIYMSTNKLEINKKMQEFEGYQIAAITPMPMAITNVAEIKSKENCMIVNLDEKTTATTIIDGNLYNVDIVEKSVKDILEKISVKENSYSKAYEICKNSTIYTAEGKDLKEEDNLYLEDIMPTLYEIVNEVKNIIEKSVNKVEKIYITGTGSIINNIDLYFQEFFGQIKCEILKPYFIQPSLKINIKDYIEVNSAIALAMSGLGYGVKGINFKKPTFSDKLPAAFKLEVGGKKGNDDTTGEPKKTSNFNFNFSLKGSLDGIERWMLRTAIGFIELIIIYIVIVVFLNTQITKKQEEVAAVKTDTQTQMSAIDRDVSSINSKTTRYQDMKQNLEDLNSELTENNSTKNIVTNLLSNIMYYIPQGVTITSIENSTGRHIVINAESERYDLLGYFKGVIQTRGILTPTSVVSTSGVKQDDTVRIVIEGDMP